MIEMSYNYTPAAFRLHVLRFPFDAKIKEICGKYRSELILYEDSNHADSNFNTKENSEIIADFLSRCMIQ